MNGKEKKGIKPMNTAALFQPFAENFGSEEGLRVIFCKGPRI